MWSDCLNNDPSFYGLNISKYEELTNFRDGYIENYGKYILIVIGQCLYFEAISTFKLDKLDSIEEHSTNENFNVELCHAILITITFS